jgi:hypothetical protein
MTFYIKELPDNTVTLLTSSGQIIGKFDSADKAANITLKLQENQDEQTAPGYD